VVAEVPTLHGPSRAGNAMGRARAGALAGALACVTDRGTAKTTMSAIAVSGALAKATLYNHFRTKDEVWAALVEDEVDALAELAVDASIADRLAAVAGALAGHPALARLRADEPETIARLVSVGTDGSWESARDHLRTGLGVGASDEAVDVALRWVASHIAAPGNPHTRHAGALIVAAACEAQDS
jgi:AcrR family transcriptional regulator